MAWKPSSRDRQFFADNGYYQSYGHPDKRNYRRKRSGETEEQYQEWKASKKASYFERYNGIEALKDQEWLTSEPRTTAEIARRAKDAEDKKAADKQSADRAAAQQAREDAWVVKRDAQTAEAKIRADAKAKKKAEDHAAAVKANTDKANTDKADEEQRLKDGVKITTRNSKIPYHTEENWQKEQDRMWELSKGGNSHISGYSAGLHEWADSNPNNPAAALYMKHLFDPTSHSSRAFGNSRNFDYIPDPQRQLAARAYDKEHRALETDFSGGRQIGPGGVQGLLQKYVNGGTARSGSSVGGQIAPLFKNHQPGIEWSSPETGPGGKPLARATRGYSTKSELGWKFELLGKDGYSLVTPDIFESQYARFDPAYGSGKHPGTLYNTGSALATREAYSEKIIPKTDYAVFNKGTYDERRKLFETDPKAIEERRRIGVGGLTPSTLADAKDRRDDLRGATWDDDKGWIYPSKDDTPEMIAARQSGQFIMVRGKDGKLFVPKNQQEREANHAYWNSVLKQGKAGEISKESPEYKMAVEEFGARGLAGSLIEGYTGIKYPMFMDDKNNAAYENLKDKENLSPSEHLSSVVSKEIGSAANSAEKVQGSQALGEAAYDGKTKEKYGGLTWEEYVAKARDKKAGGEYDAKEQRRDVMGDSWDEASGAWVKAGPNDTPEMKASRVMIRGEDGKLFVPTTEERARHYANIDNVLAQADPNSPEYKQASEAMVARGLSGQFIEGVGIDKRMFLDDKQNAEYKDLKAKLTGDSAVAPAEVIQQEISRESVSEPLVASDEKVKGSQALGASAYSQDTQDTSESSLTTNEGEATTVASDTQGLRRGDYQSLLDAIDKEALYPIDRQDAPNAVRQRKLELWQKQNPGNNNPPEELRHKTSLTPDEMKRFDLSGDGRVDALDALLFSKEHDKRTPEERTADSAKAYQDQQNQLKMRNLNKANDAARIADEKEEWLAERNEHDTNKDGIISIAEDDAWREGKKPLVEAAVETRPDQPDLKTPGNRTAQEDYIRESQNNASPAVTTTATDVKADDEIQYADSEGGTPEEMRQRGLRRAAKAEYEATAERRKTMTDSQIRDEIEKEKREANPDRNGTFVKNPMTGSRVRWEDLPISIQDQIVKGTSQGWTEWDPKDFKMDVNSDGVIDQKDRQLLSERLTGGNEQMGSWDDFDKLSEYLKPPEKIDVRDAAQDMLSPEHKASMEYWQATDGDRRHVDSTKTLREERAKKDYSQTYWNVNGVKTPWLEVQQTKRDRFLGGGAAMDMVPWSDGGSEQFEAEKENDNQTSNVQDKPNFDAVNRAVNNVQGEDAMDSFRQEVTSGGTDISGTTQGTTSTVPEGRTSYLPSSQGSDRITTVTPARREEIISLIEQGSSITGGRTGVEELNTILSQRGQESQTLFFNQKAQEFSNLGLLQSDTGVGQTIGNVDTGVGQTIGNVDTGVGQTINAGTGQTQQGIDPATGQPYGELDGDPFGELVTIPDNVDPADFDREGIDPATGQPYGELDDDPFSSPVTIPGNNGTSDGDREGIDPATGQPYGELDDDPFSEPVTIPDNEDADDYGRPPGTFNDGRIWDGERWQYPRPDGTYGPEPYTGGSEVGPDGTITWPWAPGSSMSSDGVISNPTGGTGIGTGTGTGGAATIGDINIDFGGRDGQGNLEPGGEGQGQGHMTTADAIEMMRINAEREAAARAQQAAFDKSAREARSKSEALAGQRLINQDKWNALGGLMGMLGKQRKSLYTDLKGPVGYVNTTTGGYSRYQDAAPGDGGRGAIANAGDQPGRINAPSSADVAAALGNAPAASGELQGQIADAMRGAAAPEAASMAASLGQAAEENEMASKTAASKQGLDLAKLAYDLGNKKRNLRQGLDQSTVASMTPMIAAKTPDVVKYNI